LTRGQAQCRISRPLSQVIVTRKGRSIAVAQENIKLFSKLSWVKFFFPNLYKALSILTVEAEFQRERIDDLAKEVYGMRKKIFEIAEFDDELKETAMRSNAEAVKRAEILQAKEWEVVFKAERSDTPAKENEQAAPECPIHGLDEKTVEVMRENICSILFIEPKKSPMLDSYIRSIHESGAQQQLENMSEYILKNFYIYKKEEFPVPTEDVEIYMTRVTDLSEFLSFFR